MDTMPNEDPMQNPSPTPLGGLDPADLLKQGLAEDTFVDDPSSPFVPPSIDELAPLFPQFEILELIGKGGMGAVYKIRQKDLDRIVALKILPPEIGRSPEFSNRFTREAKALAKLNHPGIVTIHEFGERDGLYFILMEFVDGVNLAQLMKSGRISPREALTIVPQICDALQFAHDQGIVHRDIKPENLLLDRLGRVKVADFGIAKVVAAVCDRRTAEEDEVRRSQTNATLAGKIIGTPAYMAPEQIEHPSDVDHRADIYALGVVFYQMLTGELPGTLPAAPSRKIHLDVRLDEIVLRALEKDPELRFQHASVMKTRVDDLRTSSTEPVKSPVKGSSTGKMIAIGCGLLALFVILGVTGLGTVFWWFKTSRMDAEKRALAANRSQVQFSQLKPGEYKPGAFANPVQVFTLERGGPLGGVDLDTGTFVAYQPTGGLDDPKMAVRWREDHGVDLILDRESASPCVLVTGTQVQDVASDWWDEAPEAALVESVLPPFEKSRLFDQRMAFLCAVGQGSKTHVYRTLEGSVGILRLGPTYSAGGVRAEWRLIVDRHTAVKVTGTMALPKDFPEAKQAAVAKAALALLDSCDVTEESSQSKMLEAENGTTHIQITFPEAGSHPDEILITFPLTSGSVWTRKGAIYQRHAMFAPTAAVALAEALGEKPTQAFTEAARPHMPWEVEVEVAAKRWLAGIDAGDYAQSWNTAARLFQQTITEVGWIDALTKVRKPLGSLNTRKLLDVKIAKTFPKMPDGEYAVMHFKSSFVAREITEETVTLMKEKDGTWKAVGYFIH